MIGRFWKRLKLRKVEHEELALGELRKLRDLQERKLRELRDLQERKLREHRKLELEHEGLAPGELR